MNTSPTDLTTKASSLNDGWVARSRKLRLLPAWLRVALLVSTTLLIGYLDHLGGRGASFFVFYAVPILLMTWLVDLKAGLWLAVISGPVWWNANDASHRDMSSWTMLWATFGRIVYFSFIAVGAAAIRTKQEADAEQIEMLREMRQLEMEIVTTRENEQQRIGQDLHDGLCQQLAAISCAARALSDDLQARGIPEAEDAGKISDAIERNIAEARGLAGGMASLNVGHQGLAAALATLVQTTHRLTGVAMRLHAPPTVKVEDPETATHLFRIAQEAVGNAVRHSGADEVSIRLEEKGHYLELRIDDTGRGLPTTPKHRTTGIGLQTMQFRAHALGADFIIHPRSGGGTSVRCTLPLKKQASSEIHVPS